eukprot:gene2731-2982_t
MSIWTGFVVILFFSSVLAYVNRVPRPIASIRSKSCQVRAEGDEHDPLHTPLTQQRKAAATVCKGMTNLLSSAVFMSLLSGKVGAAAAEGEGSGPLPKGTVVVLGGSGKTARLIVDNLREGGVPVRPTLRDTSKDTFSSLGGSVLPTVYADVTKPESLSEAIAGASTVIFAASASKKGGNAQQVDFQGVSNVAKECVRLRIPRLVVISSGAVTKPNSLGFKITNLFGGIMEYKLQGEKAVETAYEGSGLTYVIVRPGGLLDGAAQGPTKMELNQGDTISGEITRADLAQCVAAVATASSLPGSVIFEVYEAGKGGPLESSFPTKSGYEQRGNSYAEMLKNLKVVGDVKL